MAVSFLIAFCLILTSVTSEEPHCSRYHYEEQTLSKMLRMEIHVEQLEAEIRHLNTKVGERLGEFRDEKDILKTKLNHMEYNVKQLLNKQSQSSYVRWGREDCPGNGTDLLYKGYMAGNQWNQYGGGSTSICLPDTPTWAEHIDGYQNGALIFGTEIEIDATLSKRLFGTEVSNDDLSCSVCVSIRASVIMVPGHSKCLPGWTEEYQGYLVASHPDWKGTSDFVCLDGDFLKGQQRVNDQHVIRVVEAQCGNLPCPPYVQGREVACVVCTK